MEGVLEILERIGGERRIHYALDHFKEALREIGNPEQNVKSFVIAGTNGKGSTTLFISAALIEAGHTVATFLSPHLQHPKERLLHNLISIDSFVLDQLAREYSGVANQFQLTYFEFLTLLFFVWASKKNVEYVVLEVGLGGRLDSTNVTKPLACALTNVSFDHMAYLGTTLEQILAEKIAVVPKGRALFTGVSDPSLVGKIQSYCKCEEIEISFATRVPIKTLSRSWNGQQVLIDGIQFSLKNPTPVTAKNAALAYCLLQKMCPEISKETLIEAFKNIRTPGRFEIVQENPRVILSGDHNPAGIESLLETLKEMPPTRLHIICGFSPDKPKEEMLKQLKTVSSDVQIVPISSAKEQVLKILKECPKNDTLLITGSLYLVGEVRGLWKSSAVILGSDS